MDQAHDSHRRPNEVHQLPATPVEPGYPEHPEQHLAPPPLHHAEHVGHDKHAGHSVAMFRQKFWVSLALTIPTLVWGHMLQRAFGYTAPHFSGSAWIPPLFGTAVFIYGGWVFIQGAVSELRERLPSNPLECEPPLMVSLNIGFFQLNHFGFALICFPKVGSLRKLQRMKRRR